MHCDLIQHTIDYYSPVSAPPPKPTQTEIYTVFDKSASYWHFRLIDIKDCNIKILVVQ